ncbi:uncharacterized protein LOC113867966 [Abrus precatorius]|uniref:Small ribosomal subunit protein mS38 n=1 Tax=Abrus precatorius TaxID=3816 RepID=A0A8B8LU41_ABRPR|nr:uncharacterized protein LOC113867966 [Abrus precatorius]
MASALQKVLRKSVPPFPFITAFRPSQSPNPILEFHNPSSPTSPAPTPVTHHSAPSTLIFPTFPFGFSPKPLFASGFFFPEESVSEESGTLWADSVKKKRKKKMNKHKYQKLRKRMRRQT